MHWHSLPAARGCAVGRPRCRAAAHPPLPPPTLAYSPICPPRSSRSLEPPEEHGQHSRGSSRGWSPERRGCPRSRASRHPRRGGHPVAPHWSWPILVVSSGWCCARNAMYHCGPAAAPLSMGPWRPHGERRSPSGRPGCFLRSPSPGRAQVHASIQHLRCPLGEKGSFPKMTLDTPYSRAATHCGWR